ncbi:helix-turn-helix domain-containing protein [Desulfobacter curvatus]|uniref:helix-turn-helix domain-containing protein n=1 Tax=Desulfobacter curvatus TaxID=2290 RepID=UPI00036D0A33|nr:helix-turn-helix transcriptional regulator [Desulfobacter curvatus]
MTEVLENIGKHIRDLRGEKKLSQQALAELAGISYKYLGEIERGQVNLSVEILIKIAESLQVPPGELLNDVINDETKIVSRIKSIFSELSKKDSDAALEILNVFYKHMKS